MPEVDPAVVVAICALVVSIGGVIVNARGNSSAKASAEAANTTAKQSLEVARDQSEIELRPKLDDHRQLVGLTNLSTQTLHDVRIIAWDNYQGREEVNAVLLAPVEDIGLALPGWDNHIDEVMEQSEQPAFRSNGRGFGTKGSAGAGYRVDVVISFKTETGALRTANLTHKIFSILMAGKLTHREMGEEV